MRENGIYASPTLEPWSSESVVPLLFFLSPLGHSLI